MSRSFWALVILSISLLTPDAARAQALPQRWILAGDSIQTGTFPNVEFGIPGGDARDLTQAIIQQETGVVISNVSAPGATMTSVFAPFFRGLVEQNSMIDFVNGFGGATGILITIGVNDAGSTLDLARFQQDYASFVTFARGRNLKVVCSLPLNEPGEVADVNVSRRFAFQLAVFFACQGAGVPAENIFNPAAVGIAPDLNNPARRRLFASAIVDGQLQQDSVHLSREGHRLFATKLIDFMVQRGSGFADPRGGSPPVLRVAPLAKAAGFPLHRVHREEALSVWISTRAGLPA